MKRHTFTFGFLAALSSAVISPVTAQSPQLAAQSTSDDPFIWLEDVDGKRSMDWVNAKNAATVAELSNTPLYQPLFTRIKTILDSRDRIANPNMSERRSTTSGRTPTISAESGDARQ